jgi:hypothetical protein
MPDEKTINCAVCGVQVQVQRLSARYCRDCKPKAVVLNAICRQLNRLNNLDAMGLLFLMQNAATVPSNLMDAFPILEDQVNYDLISVLNIALSDYGRIEWNGNEFRLARDPSQTTLRLVGLRSLVTSNSSDIGGAIEQMAEFPEPDSGGVSDPPGFDPINCTGVDFDYARMRVLERLSDNSDLLDFFEENQLRAHTRENGLFNQGFLVITLRDGRVLLRITRQRLELLRREPERQLNYYRQMHEERMRFNETGRLLEQVRSGRCNWEIMTWLEYLFGRGANIAAFISAINWSAMEITEEWREMLSTWSRHLDSQQPDRVVTIIDQDRTLARNEMRVNEQGLPIRGRNLRRM